MRIQEPNGSMPVLSGLEKIIFSLILLFCVFGFYFFDLDITSLHGWAFLDAVWAGKALHYYSFALPYHEVPPVYDISYYAIFGIWELPLWLLKRIFGCPISPWLRIFWCKILLILCYFQTIKLTTGLVRHFAPEEERRTVWRWMLLAPLATSIFISGQYDIIYLLVMVWGFSVLIEKKNLPLAALIFGFGGIFKYFPVMAAVPVFLLVEKKKLRLAGCFLVGLVPMVLTKLFLLFDVIPSVSQIRSAHFKHMFGRLFAPEIALGSGKISVFIVLYVLICFLAYARCIRDDEEQQKKEILYLPLLVYSLLFFCIHWHGQWLLLLVPFFTLAAVWNPRFRTEIFFASLLVFIGTLVLSPHGNWFRICPVADLLPKMEALPEEAKYTFGSLLTHFELVPILVTSLYAAGVIALVLFSWPGWKREPVPKEKSLSRPEFWLGYGCVAAFLFLTVALDLLSVQAERNLFEPESQALVHYRPSWKKMQKNFTSPQVVNGIHLMQKQLIPPLCLVPRHIIWANPSELVIQPCNGVKAELKAIHLLLEKPLDHKPGISVQKGGKVSRPEINSRDGQHLVISPINGMLPDKILFEGNDSITLSEYFLEFNEKGGKL